MAPSRATWASQTDEQLLVQCDVDTYRASGPGGQKRNKTSSAVRLRHKPSGLMAIAEESRSQHENKARALRRLRRSLFLLLREAVTTQSLALRTRRNGDGRIGPGVKHPDFWPRLGVILDALLSVEARVPPPASFLAPTTTPLP